MQQLGSNYFARSPQTLVGSKGKNSTFSEHGPVAYQIESGMQHMVANILRADPTDAGGGIKR